MTKLTTEQVKELPELRKKGMNNQEIADSLGCSIHSITRWFQILKRKGYEVPPAKMGRRPLL